MLYFGVDPHKDNHVISICNESNKFISTKSIKVELEGYEKALEWAKEQSSDRVWGIENPQSYARCFAQYLVSKGEKVLAVPAQLTGVYRKRSLLKEKTDKNDALAVARATLQEEEKLKPVLKEKETETLNIIIEHYDNLKSENTRIINRLHAQLRNLDVKEESELKTQKALKSLIKKSKIGIKGEFSIRWQIVKSMSERSLEIIEEIKKLDKQITKILMELKVKVLLDIEGVGEYIAAKILGIVGSPSLFSDEASFASYAGVSPISCSSGKNTNYRVNPGGNRKLNSSIYTVVFTQLRIYEPSKKYYEKKKSEGKTPKEAKRNLKRMVARRIFKALQSIESLKVP